MSVVHPRTDLEGRPTGIDAVTGVVALLLLFVGVAGLLPPAAVLALAVGASSTLSTIRLVRLSHWAGICPPRATDPRPTRRATTRSEARALRRSANLLDLAVFSGGLVVATMPLVPATNRAGLAVAGLIISLLLHLGGVLLMPGVLPPTPGRLRLLVDVLGLGVSFAFAACAVVPLAPVAPPVRFAVLVGAAALAAAIVMALATWGHRRGAALCALGAASALFGFTGLVVLAGHARCGLAALLFLPALVAAPLLTAAGARLAADNDAPAAAGLRLPTYPMLTAPAGVATVAAAFHLLVVGQFETDDVVLGLAVIPLVVLREILATVDIRRYARQLASQEAYFRSLVSGAHDLTLVVGANDLVVRWQSPAATRLFGLTDVEVVGRPFADLMHPDDVERVVEALAGVLAGGRPPLVDARLRDGRGTWRETESTITDQRAVPEVAALVVHVRDVSERLRLERTVHQLEVTDQLTGLANRRELMRALGRRERSGRRGALLVVDLHGMAAVNDGHGRAAGDQVLVEAGRRLRAAAGADDTVARLAGDEFAVASPEGPVAAYALATRLLAVLTQPYPLPGANVVLQVSIGLAEFVETDEVDDVLRQADLARRRARQLGRNRVEWYDSCLEEQLVRRLDLERELPGAVTRGELDLVFQPILNLVDQLPVGTEALLRWRSPSLGTVLPAELLPVAEDLGLVDEIGRWVLQRACRQLAVWAESSRGLWMAVNVSPRELTTPDVVPWVTNTLAEYGIAPDRLVVEVSESRLAGDLTGLVPQLAGLRALGVRIALDDFGGGQASLTRLRRLPLDLLKADPKLVSGDEGCGMLLDVVVELGRRLGLPVVAEGLETGTRVDRARQAGCGYGQGYVLSRPATAERVEAYLAEFPSASR